jgi:hypothetical protein
MISEISLTQKKALRPLENEKGTVLVLALGVLVVMSILGALVLSATQTESGISGNYRTAQLAFHAADRTIEYAMVDATIYTTLITVDSVFDLTQVAGNIDTENSRLSAGEVIFTSSGSLPPGSGSDPTYFQSRYYVIDVTAEGPNRASSRVEAQVARIVPK